MPRLEQLDPGLMFGDDVLQVATRNLAHLITRSHDDRKLVGMMVLAPCAIPNKHAEKSPKAERFIRSDGLQMTAKWLGTHIDAEDGLGLRSHNGGRVKRPLNICGR